MAAPFDFGVTNVTFVMRATALRSYKSVPIKRLCPFSSYVLLHCSRIKLCQLRVIVFLMLYHNS